MPVRAKFRVNSKSEPSSEGDVANISLGAVYDGSEENKRFFKYTPSGQIQMGTINAEAANQFEVGDEFYVDFTKVPKVQEPAAGH
jgi:hypothetical protein